MDAPRTVTLNIRLLLWQRDKTPGQWPSQVSSWLNSSLGRAREILNGDRPLDHEIAAICDATQVDPETLLYGDLLQGVDVLRNNLVRLLGSLPHGGQGELANTLGVARSTVSKWASGKQKPPRNRWGELATIFAIDSAEDLSKVPLFLSLEPVAPEDKRRWLVDRLANLPSRELALFYPALKKLLE